MLSSVFEALLWPVGQSPKPCRIDLRDRAGVRLVDSKFAGPANLYGFIHDRSYALGEFLFADGVGKRPEYVDNGGIRSAKVAKNIEKSALNRLCTLLQRDGSVGLEVKVAGLTLFGRIKPLQTATAGRFFVCDVGTEAPLFAEREAIVVIHLLGMTYTVTASVLDRSDGELALSLPTSATRLLRRFSPRVNGSWKVQLAEPFHGEGRLVNLSPLGICVETERESLDISPWTEIQMKLTSAAGDQAETHGLVVAKRDRFLHILLAGTAEKMKDRFFAFGREIHKPFQFREDPQQAWECLDHFKYLDLMEDGVISSVRDDCISAWNDLMGRDIGFQPVAFSGNEPVGTIGAVQAADDHWVPHALATKVDPALIDVCSALYMSWPNYILSLARPVWVSTWYDANKPWHNRFYQVFIKENEDNPHVVTFVRQYYLAPKLMSFSQENLTFLLIEGDDPGKDAVHGLWQERWGRLTESPVLKLESKEESLFHHTFGEIRRGETLVGSFKLVTSAKEVNPFCVLQSIHINLFAGGERQKQEYIVTVIKAALNFLGQLGLKRAAVTLDYDLTLEDPKSLGLAYFGETRCLSTTAPLLPALTSNNALAFADMKIRKAG